MKLTYEEYCATCSAKKVRPAFEREVYEKVADLLPEDPSQPFNLIPILQRLHPAEALRPLDNSAHAAHAALLRILPKSEAFEE